MTPYRRARGFTLVELLAALSLMGLVLLGAVLLLARLTDAGDRIAADGAAAAAEGNGARMLRQLAFDARVSADTGDRFKGQERETEFSTVCDRPSGWRTACRANLAIDLRSDSSVLLAALSTGEHLELSRYAGHATLRYFDPDAADSLWSSRWTTSIAMPGAIGIITGGDTLIYAMGNHRE